MGRALITLISPKSFYNHIFITRQIFSKLKFWNCKLLFWIHVIFMEFFISIKKLKCVFQCIRNVTLHRMKEFWWAPKELILGRTNQYFACWNFSILQKLTFYQAFKWLDTGVLSFVYRFSIFGCKTFLLVLVCDFRFRLQIHYKSRKSKKIETVMILK